MDGARIWRLMPIMIRPPHDEVDAMCSDQVIGGGLPPLYVDYQAFFFFSVEDSDDLSIPDVDV